MTEPPTDRDAKIAAAVALAIRDVAELPDRDSPEEWPEAMLVTGPELEAILTNRLRDCPAAPDGKALREAIAELRDWVAGQRDAASSDYKASGSADVRAHCNIEIHAYQRVMGQIDRLLTAAPVADAEVEALRQHVTRMADAIYALMRHTTSDFSHFGDRYTTLDEQQALTNLDAARRNVPGAMVDLRAENARLQADLTAARADQAATARRELEAVQSWLFQFRPAGYPNIQAVASFCTDRLAALPQPKPAAEPVPAQVAPVALVEAADSLVWQDFCSAFSLRVSRLPTIARAAIDGAPLVDRFEVMRALKEELQKIFPIQVLTSVTPADKSRASVEDVPRR